MVENSAPGSEERQTGVEKWIKIDNFQPGTDRPYQTKYVAGPLQCEISTHWLGKENPGMNVAIYTPEYKSMQAMIMCVYPGGRFEFSRAERDGE